jgi:DNA-directed RNA polymerase specialized sigma24 family protein
MKVFLHASEFDSRRDALSWVLGVAAYEIKTARRRQQRRRETDADLETRVDPAASPEEHAVARDLDDAIDAALRDLPPTDAATLRAYADGERPPDVAPATFRKRVERGLDRLRALWRASHER